MSTLYGKINQLILSPLVQGKPSPGQWTVLSGIVLQHGPDLSLLSLATGTKCLSGSGRLSAPPGALVHDSHAEVLARRAITKMDTRAPIMKTTK